MIELGSPYILNMYLTHFIGLWPSLASFFPLGHSSQIHEEESSSVNEVIKALPTAECDAIVVSSSSFLGKIYLYIEIVSSVYCRAKWH